MSHTGYVAFAASYDKACKVLYAVYVLHWSMTQAGIRIGLNTGTVSHICRGNRFPHAVPIPFDDE